MNPTLLPGPRTGLLRRSPLRLPLLTIALLSGLGLATLHPLQAQTIRYVKPSATGTGTGSSWANASGDLQAMIKASQAGDQVWVGAGLYTPTPGTDRSVSFSIPSGVQLYGGFVGTESSVSQRPLINPVNGQPSSTTLSGNIGDEATAADNSFSVVRLRNASAQTRLDGLVITGGNANGSFPNNAGGGISNDGSDGGSSNPTLVNLSLVANQAASLGGGLVNNGGNGGNSSPVLTNVSFVGNSASFGGGLLNRGAVQGNSSPVLTNVSFVGNSATSNGGAINNSGVEGSCNPVLTNVSFVGNSAAGNGGAIFSGGGRNSASSQLTNVSFQANTAQQGRAVLVLDASLSLTNGIIFNNGLGDAITNLGSSTITARFCLFEAGLSGYTDGEGNRTTTTSPFLSATSTRLAAGSLAIDAGNSSAPGLTGITTDLAGNNRIVGCQVDLGPYEFQTNTSQPLAITQQPASSSTVAAGANVRVPVGLNVTATSLQWFNQAGLVSGQTSTTLRLNGVTTSQAGSYSLVATGPCNSVTTTAFSLSVSPPCNPVVYVTQAGAGLQNGTSWTNALSGTALQGALATACGSTTFLVGAGLYTPTTGTNRSVSFSIPSGVQLYGGFVGTESSVSQRPLINPVNGQPSSTTLSGNIGDEATAADNSFSVVRLRNASAQTRLDGLVITGGNASGSFPNEYGGGIRNDGSGNGGSSRPVLTNISLIGNLATARGGAIHNNGRDGGSSSLVLTNVSFVGNSATAGSGGAIYNDGVSGSSSPVLTNVSFQTNTAVGNGGAIYNSGFFGSSSPVLTNVSFVGNSATAGNGGAIYNDGFLGSSSPVLTNVSFVGNSAAGNGGAIVSDGGSGGSSSSQLTNVSFQVNTAAQQGRAVYLLDASLSLTNGIIFNNGLGDAITNLGSSTITARFCLFEAGLSGYTDGGNNRTTTTSPFLSATTTQLNACAPAIDAGDNAVDAGSTDLAGNTRRVRTIDIGAYEFQGPSPLLAITQQPPSGSAVCAGGSVSVSVSVSGTVSAYQWYKNNQPLANQTSATLSLPNVTTANQGGSYSVVVTGTCTSLTSTAFSLTVNSAPSVSISPASKTICAGQTATLTASGASSYQWQGPDSFSSSANPITVSAPGTYSVTATTIQGCSASATAILDVTNLVLGGSATDVNCFGRFDGQATVTVSGGSGDYDYAWSPSGGTRPTARGLSPGNYTVSVFDRGSNCRATRSFTISQPTALTSTLSLTNVSTYGGQDGAARLTVSGGTPPYGYNWEPATPSGEGTNAVSGLTAGDYSVLITDARQCSLTRSFTIGQPAAPPTITDFRASAASVCAGTAVVFTAALSNVGETYSYTLTVGASRLSGTSSQQPFSQSLTVAGSGTQLAGLSVSTANGLASIKTAVRVNALPSVSISPSTTAVCEDQPATLTAAGADTGETLTYQWQGPGGFRSAQAVISVSTPGSYSVTGTTSAGCSVSATTSLRVNPLPAVSISPSSLTLTCSSPAASLLARGASVYQWRGPEGFVSMAPSVTVTTPGTYTLTGTTSGCSASVTTTVGQNTSLAPPALRTVSGQSALTVPQYSGSVTLLIHGCSGQAAWSGPNNTSGTSTTITVPTSQTGTLVYSATCRLGSCTGNPVSATVTVQAAPLQLVVGIYDCASRTLTLATTGGNGQALEYHINSVTSGWQSVSTSFKLEAKHIGKELKLRARQRNASGGWNETTLSFTPTACGARLGAEVVEVPLTVRVLGNPVTGQQVEVEVRGAQGQSLWLQVVDLRGQVVDRQQRSAAQAIESVQLRLGETAGIYLLQVATPQQAQTIKLLKP